MSTKFSGFNPLTTLNGSGEIVGIDSGSNFRITKTNFLKEIQAEVDLKLAIADLDDTPADDSETAVTSKWIFDNIGTSPAFLPTGTTISLRQDSTAPTGYLYEDGSAISRTTYSDLFTAIGTVYGVGDGSTTFNLPDSRETVNVGIGTKGSGVTAHDTYTIGQFKDDQGEEHTHGYTTHSSNANFANANIYQGGSDAAGTTGGSSGRAGTTTHGKQMGVKKYIKY